jgi:hypothetical protein
LLLGVVTFLAAWYHIAFDGFTAPRDGNDMVHGEFSRWKISSAIVTFTFGKLTFPPLTFSQLSCLVSLALEITFLWMKKFDAFGGFCSHDVGDFTMLFMHSLSVPFNHEPFSTSA